MAKINLDISGFGFIFGRLFRVLHSICLVWQLYIEIYPEEFSLNGSAKLGLSPAQKQDKNPGFNPCRFLIKPCPLPIKL